MAAKVTSRDVLEAAIQRAESELSDASERGDAAAIQRAEIRLSNAMERLERYHDKAMAGQYGANGEHS